MKQHSIIEEKCQYYKDVRMKKWRRIIMIESLFHYNVETLQRCEEPV